MSSEYHCHFEPFEPFEPIFLTVFGTAIAAWTLFGLRIPQRPSCCV